jgi:hypothetical protein
MLLMAFSAQVWAVTIDFEDFGGTVVPLVDQGLIFTSDPAGANVNPAPGTDGQALGCSGGCTFTIEAVDSSVFGLNTIDAYVGGFPTGSIENIFVSLTGHFTGGSTQIINEILIFGVGTEGDTHTFMPYWTGLERVEVGAFICSSCVAGFAIDNVNASVVPLPAAVWLFGSALGGLGLIRRRKYS